MESWNRIINAALLGTEKRGLRKEEMDAAFAESVDAIAQQTQNGEEAFLQTASLVYNYRQCGFVPLKKEAVALPRAEEEEKAYASATAHSVLNEVMESGSSSLLQFWLERCADKKQIVGPDFIPLLFDAGVKSKSLQPLLRIVGGKRGEWLTQFNPQWKWGEAATDEELWQTGTLPQRKAVLSEIRKSDAAKVRELLQQTWPQEPAATKTELLEVLFVNAGNEDVDWLESLQNEKSVKVKEAALAVLKTIPSSAVVQSYWAVLSQSMQLNASKGILGIGGKTSLKVKLTGVEPSLFKTGIEQVSSQKGIAEDVFVLQQLVALVPPNFWEKHLAVERKKIIDLFLKDEKHRSFVTSLGEAAVRFKDVEWLREIIAADGETFHPDALDLLPQNEAEKYAVKFLGNDEYAGWVMQRLDAFGKEWSADFAKAVLRFAAKNPYQYHRGFYGEVAHLLPITMITDLENFNPKDDYFKSLWTTQREYIAKLLTIKQKIINAFDG